MDLKRICSESSRILSQCVTVESFGDEPPQHIDTRVTRPVRDDVEGFVMVHIVSHPYGEGRPLDLEVPTRML